MSTTSSAAHAASRPPPARIDSPREVMEPESVSDTPICFRQYAAVVATPPESMSSGSTHGFW